MIHTVPHDMAHASSRAAGDLELDVPSRPGCLFLVVPRGTEMFIWVWLGVLWLLICSDYGLHESAR